MIKTEIYIMKKAYNYYVNNINKSCNTNIIDEQSFHQAFAAFLQSLELTYAFQPEIVNIPLYNDKCKTSKIVNLNTVLNKIK